MKGRPSGGWALRVRITEEKVSLDVCVLSPAEAGRLEHYGIWPECKKHHHVSKNKAARFVATEETHRFVGGADTAVQSAGTLSMIVETNTSRVWSPVPCQDERGRAVMGLRTWGLASTR